MQRASDCTAAIDALNVTRLRLGMATFDGGVGVGLSNDTIRLCHAANDAVTARAAYEAVCADGACVARKQRSPVSPPQRCDAH
jgi:hypothetical protein